VINNENATTKSRSPQENLSQVGDQIHRDFTLDQTIGARHVQWYYAYNTVPNSSWRSNVHTNCDVGCNASICRMWTRLCTKNCWSGTDWQSWNHFDENRAEAFTFNVGHENSRQIFFCIQMWYPTLCGASIGQTTSWRHAEDCSFCLLIPDDWSYVSSSSLWLGHANFHVHSFTHKSSHVITRTDHHLLSQYIISTQVCTRTQAPGIVKEDDQPASVACVHCSNEQYTWSCHYNMHIFCMEPCGLQASNPIMCDCIHCVGQPRDNRCT